MTASAYRQNYPEGTRILLISMGDDPNPIASGTRATVKYVDDIGTVHCKFDNGRSLGLVPGEDSFRKLTKSELEQEANDNQQSGQRADCGPQMTL